MFGYNTRMFVYLFDLGFLPQRPSWIPKRSLVQVFQTNSYSASFECPSSWPWESFNSLSFGISVWQKPKTWLRSLTKHSMFGYNKWIFVWSRVSDPKGSLAYPHGGLNRNPHISFLIGSSHASFKCPSFLWRWDVAQHVCLQQLNVCLI